MLQIHVGRETNWKRGPMAHMAGEENLPKRALQDTGFIAENIWLEIMFQRRPVTET